VFSDEDKILIKNLYLLKSYRPTKLTREFPQKNWKKLLKKICEIGTVQLIGKRGAAARICGH